jgi:type II secretory pathway component GspD/PulD (secretin)
MKSWLYLTLFLSCALACPAQEDLGGAPFSQDLTPAEKSFQRAVKLEQQGKLDKALEELNKAVKLAPGEIKYATARELLRSQIAGRHIDQGNVLAEGGDQKSAEAQFKSALAIDPKNGYAQERLHDVSPDPEREPVLQLLASVEEVTTNPNPGKSNFHIHGDTKELYEAIARAFGITIAYDSSLTSQRVRFDVDDLDFYTAMRLAGKATRTFWAPISSKRIIVANDTQEMRREYQRMALQTFYVSNAATPAELNDIANVLRNVFEVKLVNVAPGNNTITVRAPKEQMAAIAGVLDDAVQGRPEVLLDVKAYELDHNKALQYGLALPNSFTVFNVYAAIYAALGSNAQSVINQLKQTGTINPATIPIGSLANLQKSPLLQPFVFFGKGWGLTGITYPTLTGTLSSQVSFVNTLEHVTLRAENGNPATLMIGTRFPIPVGAFTNVALAATGGLPQIGATTPQFQYEDLGLTFKATPHLQAGEDVNLEVELQIKGLGTQQLNSIPVLTNRAYKGSITLKDGEPAEVAAIIDNQVQSATSGYPGIGGLPGVSSVINTNSKQNNSTEILILVTPHIIRKSVHRLDNVVWGANQ